MSSGVVSNKTKVLHDVTITKLFQSQSRQIPKKLPQSEAGLWRCHGREVSSGQAWRLASQPTPQSSRLQIPVRWRLGKTSAGLWQSRAFLIQMSSVQNVTWYPTSQEVSGDPAGYLLAYASEMHTLSLCIKKDSTFQNKLEFQEAKCLHQKWLDWDVTHSVLQNRVYLYLNCTRRMQFCTEKNEYHEWNGYNP